MLSGADKVKRGPGRPKRAGSEKNSKQEVTVQRGIDANALMSQDDEASTSQSIKNSKVEAKAKASVTQPEIRITSRSRGAPPTPVVQKMERLAEGCAPPPQSAYEVLGLQSMDPASRPPILDSSPEAKPFINWAANDCVRSMGLLRRARPLRPISGAFFDRIEVLRRVILAEIAKAGDTLTAMAAVGVVLDREALLLSAEDIYGTSKAKEVILSEDPSNYPDIATELDQLRRVKFRQAKREIRKSGAVHKTSKPNSPYVLHSPFRGRGIKVLRQPWCPRKEGLFTARDYQWGWCSRRHERTVEGMEKARGATVGRPMVKARSAFEVERGSTETEGPDQQQTAQGDRRRDRQTDRGWGVCRARVHTSFTDFHNPEKGWNKSPHTRPQTGQQGIGGSEVHLAWCKRGGRCCKEFRGIGDVGSSEGLPASANGKRCKTILGGTMEREDRGIDSASLWPLYKPLRVYAYNRVAGENDQKAIRTIYGGLYRRLLDRGQRQGDTGSWLDKGEGAIPSARCCLVSKDSPDPQRGSRISRICMECTEEDDKHNGRKKKRIQEKDKESIERWPNEEGVATGNREVAVLETGRGTNVKTCEVLDAPGEEEEDNREADSCRRRVARRPSLVDRDPFTHNRFQCECSSSLGDNNDRCFEHGVRRNFGILEQGAQQGNRKEHHHREEDVSERGKGPRQTYKHQRARSAIQGDKGEQRRLTGKKCRMVHGQCHSESCDNETRHSGIRTRGMGDDKEDIGFTPAPTHESDPQVRSREIELPSGLLVPSRGRKRQLGGSVDEDHQRLGASPRRSVGVHEGTDMCSGDTGVEIQEDSLSPPNEHDSEDLRMDRTSERSLSEDSSVSLAADGCRSDTIMERGVLVAKTGRSPRGMDSAGEIASQESNRMGNQERTLGELDCLSGSIRRELWAPGTLKKYQNIMSKFGGWMENSNTTEEPLSENLKGYIKYLSELKSGTNVETTTKILLSLLGDRINREDRRSLTMYMKVCKKAANQHNPPAVKASEAIKYSELIDLLRRAAAVNISDKEQLALDVLVVSFCTLSRAHEISALDVENVSEDGCNIMVRPKTEAKSWSLYKKCVKDGVGLQPASILKEKRKRAIRQNRRYLFQEESSNLPISTGNITKSLKNLTRRLGIEKRITAHSARKGAAVELILRGIPLVAIKAWGTWANLDTLETYVGKAIREEVALMDSLTRRLV